MANRRALRGRRSNRSSLVCPRQLVRERVLRNHSQRIIADLNIGRANGRCFCFCDQVAQPVVTRARCARIDHWRSEARETKAQTTPCGRHAGTSSDTLTDAPIAATAIPSQQWHAQRLSHKDTWMQLATGAGARLGKRRCRSSRLESGAPGEYARMDVVRCPWEPGLAEGRPAGLRRSFALPQCVFWSQGTRVETAPGNMRGWMSCAARGSQDWRRGAQRGSDGASPSLSFSFWKLNCGNPKSPPPAAPPLDGLAGEG